LGSQQLIVTFDVNLALMEQSQDRIDFKHIYDGILKVLNLERGLFLTIREMILRPGSMIKEYFGGTRKKYTHPIQYAVMLVGLYFFLFALLPESAMDLKDFQESTYTEGYNLTNKSGQPIDEEKMQEAFDLSQKMSNFIFQYMNVLTLVLIPVTAIFTFFIYRKAKFYYTEHLVLNAYIIGTYSVLGVLAIPLYIVYLPLAFFSTLLLLGYQAWAYMDIFQEKSIKGVFKGGLATFLPFFISMFVSIIAGSIFAYLQVKNGG